LQFPSCDLDLNEAYRLDGDSLEPISKPVVAHEFSGRERPLSSLQTASRDSGWLVMKSLRKRLHRFIVDDAGPTLVEYAFMLAVIVLACVAAIRGTATQMNAIFHTVAGIFH
jgi:Flp pilus assembly pilin Flp